MSDIKLNNAVIHEIQSYLAGMSWAQTEYKGEQLHVYLKGVQDALFGTGVRFKLSQEWDDVNHSYVYSVLVEQFEDAYSCWSKITPICRIYENTVKPVME